jgi:hypothetical protein
MPSLVKSYHKVRYVQYTMRLLCSNSNLSFLSSEPFNLPRFIEFTVPPWPFHVTTVANKIGYCYWRAGIETLLDPLVRNGALFLSNTLTAWTCNKASNSILFNLYRICDSLGWLVSGWPRAYICSRTLKVLTSLRNHIVSFFQADDIFCAFFLISSFPQFLERKFLCETNLLRSIDIISYYLYTYRDLSSILVSVLHLALSKVAIISTVISGSSEWAHRPVPRRVRACVRDYISCTVFI